MDFAQSRKNMIDGQLLPNRVTDPRVIDAMADVPREAFLPKSLWPVAYVDEALNVGSDRYLMEPNLIARMLQAAQVEAEDVALVVGCPSGYTAAVLAKMCGTVISVDSDAALAKRASKTLADLGIDNCVVIDSDLSQGNAKQGPYDGIFIAGGLPRVPAPIVDQLAEDGRLVYVRAGEEAVGRAMLMMREGGLISERDLFDAGTPMLPGFAPEPVFTF